MVEMPPGFRPETPPPALNLEALKANPTFVAWNNARSSVLAIKSAAEQGITHHLQMKPESSDALTAKRDSSLKAASAIEDVDKPEAKYDPATGEYRVTLQDGTVAVKNLHDAIPGIIDGLEMGASLERDLPPPGDQTPLNATQVKKKAVANEAKTALDGFTQFVQVEVTSKEPVLGQDGQPQMEADSQTPKTQEVTETIACADYRDRVEKVAREKSGVKTDDEWNGLGSDDQDAFIQLARQELGGKYSLKFEKPPAPKPEPTLPPEKEKPAMIIKDTADLVIRDVLGENIDNLSLEDIEKLEANPALAGLFIDAIAYGKAKTDQHRRFLLAGIYESLQDPSLLDLLTPGARTQIEGLSGDINLQKRIGYIREEFYQYVIGPALEGVQLPSHIDQNHMFRNITWAVAFAQHRGMNIDTIRATLMNMRAEGVVYTEGDIAMIDALVKKGNGREILEKTFHAMGADLNELNHPQEYIMKNADTILKISNNGQEFSDQEKDIREKRLLALRKYTDVENLDVVRKFKISPNFLMSAGAAAMILTMFQNTLSFGVAPAQEGREGAEG